MAPRDPASQAIAEEAKHYAPFVPEVEFSAALKVCESTRQWNHDLYSKLPIHFRTLRGSCYSMRFAERLFLPSQKHSQITKSHFTINPSLSCEPKPSPGSKLSTGKR